MANENRPTLSNGKICHVEIPALDVSVSVRFYQEVFGWQVRRRGDGSIAFEDTVGEVSGTWVTGRRRKRIRFLSAAGLRHGRSLVKQGEAHA